MHTNNNEKFKDRSEKDDEKGGMWWWRRDARRGYLGAT
jgi:hypothetical protein